MKSLISRSVLFLSLALSQASFAQEASGQTESDPNREPSSATKDNSSYVICRNEKRVRTIRVETKDAGGCRALYSKDGADDVVGQSTTTDLCYDVVSKIRLNLEKGPWKCKDMKPDRVSFTKE